MSSSKNLSLLLILSILFSFGSIMTKGNGNSMTLVNMDEIEMHRENIASANDVNILVLMDHDFGTSYSHICAAFESYGWNVTIAGTNATLSAYYCATDMVPDIVYTDIDDITVYDAISIMPGKNHDILRTNDTALDFIRDAVLEDVVVSAWCRAVRVLAAADVIDGKNITGHADYAAEYEAAGATFNELVPPIIDGNIVTSVRSLYWRFETYQAIATAIGVYDGTPPEIEVVSCHPNIISTDSSSFLSISFNDETWIDYVEVEIYLLNDVDERVSVNATLCMDIESSGTGVYETNITGLDNGNYTMDVTAVDAFANEVVYPDVMSLTVIPEATSTGLLFPMDIILIGSVIGGVVVIIAIIVVKTRGK
ncbi:MAG: DJ-1/PfpI family protein [Candidatus Thorarchaeota archaeon]